MANPSFCTLKYRTVLEITGPEAADFLQNLVTNNIDKISADQAIYAALLTPQGKILFDFFISQPSPQVFWLECSTAQSADLAKRLTFYKLRADVTIKALSDELQVIAVWGDGTQDLFASTQAGNAGAILGGYGYIDPRSAQAGLRVILDKNAKLTGVIQGDIETYEALRIELGLPDTDADIGSSQRFPHECNLDMTNGVDFSKGCYVGQEVVSRMHHKDAARKRILPISAQNALASDTKITASEKAIGDILSTSGTHGLAAIRLDRADQAFTNNAPLQVDETIITLTKPEWATFDFPGDKK